MAEIEGRRPDAAGRQDAGDPPGDEDQPRLALGLFGVADTVKTLSRVGVMKTKINPAQGVLLGWQAATYLGFAAFLAWMVLTAVSADMSPGFAKILSSVAFASAALVLVVIHGTNLVTGDYMTSGLSLMTRQSRWREVLWEWSITHSGHWVSGFLISWLIIVGAQQAGLGGSALMETLAGIGNTKVNELGWTELFYRGIFANWLIAMGVWGAYRVTGHTAKILMIAIPVMVFFAIGFEHSIVNHFALSAGIWAGGDYTWGEAWFKNLVPVTLGNIVGAMICQGMVFWYVSGMPTWTGPGRWKRPHGSYRDLARAVRDTCTLMIFFTAMAPLAAGAIFLFGVEPALGITAGEGSQNWVEPVGIFAYLLATALLVKRFFMPRLWHKIPES